MRRAALDWIDLLFGGFAMAPTALFDKSFLQALNVDEAVLFDAFFLPVICPLFYVETLADLSKEPAAGPDQRDPEATVGSLAFKTPQMNGAVCAHHVDMVAGSLAGQYIPMTGQIPVPHGRSVESEGKIHALFDVPPEREAFERWQDLAFDEVERRFAKRWRDELSQLNLKSLAAVVDRFAIDPKMVKNLADVRVLAEHTVENLTPDEQLRLAVDLLAVPENRAKTIRELWATQGRLALRQWAPYARHVLLVEIFFWLAIRYGKLSSERASHRADIAYLYYLPFCQVFVSSDKLHRECATLFLREDQRFVWGQDLKADLKRQKDHLLTLPEEQRRQGLIALAPRPQDGLIRELWALSVPKALKENGMQDVPKKLNDALVAMMEKIQKAPDADQGRVARDDDFNSVSMKRRITSCRGSWFQLPADFRPEAPTEDDETVQS
jgi:hypothetical protein